MTQDRKPIQTGRIILGLILAAVTGFLALTAFRRPDLGLPLASGLLFLVIGLVFGERLARASKIAAPAELPGSPGPKGGLAFESLIEVLPDPVMVITAREPDDLTARRYILANRAARDLLRLQKQEGLLVTAIRDPEVLQAIDEALFGLVAAEAVLQAGGTQERVFKALAQPLGTPIADDHLALLVLRDETDIRRAERTRADFLANASHELRTPLASLSGFIETLRGHARGDEKAQERFLGIMATQAGRMSRLIDDLLSLSRIELNEHIPPEGDTDLVLAVLDVVDALTPLAAERKVSIDTDLPAPGRIVVPGDRDQIVQVVQNLIDNALKYSPDGARIGISLQTGQSAEAAMKALSPEASRLSLLVPDPGPGLFAVLRVTDKGLGLARENLPRLTERFYRVEGQKSGERSGTGLGLAIVKHIMNRHRGGMVVESLAGTGSTFSVYFPARHGVTKLS